MTETVEKRLYAEVQKVDVTLGLVMGYAIVCTEKGEPYFDSQGDHIPEEAMLKAAADFMTSSRVMGEMHTQEDTEKVVKGAKIAGTVVFAWPMTADVAKAFGLKVAKTGLMIAVKPDGDEILDKFRLGEYTGFSIGGLRGEDEIVED